MESKAQLLDGMIKSELGQGIIKRMKSAGATENMIRCNKEVENFFTETYIKAAKTLREEGII